MSSWQCMEWLSKLSIQNSLRRQEYPTQQKAGRITGLVTPCVGTAFGITLLKEGYRKEVMGTRGRRSKQLLDGLKRKGTKN